MTDWSPEATARYHSEIQRLRAETPSDTDYEAQLALCRNLYDELFDSQARDRADYEARLAALLAERQQLQEDYELAVQAYGEWKTLAQEREAEVGSLRAERDEARTDANRNAEAAIDLYAERDALRAERDKSNTLVAIQAETLTALRADKQRLEERLDDCIKTGRERIDGLEAEAEQSELREQRLQEALREIADGRKMLNAQIIARAALAATAGEAE